MTRPCYLSQGRESDAGAIDALERASFSHPWTLGQLREVLREGRVAVLRDFAETVVAYCVFDRVADELQVQTVAVAQTRRRSGLARALLSEVLGAAARDGLEEAVLEVRADNEPACKFYTSLGFRELARRPTASLEAPAESLILSLPLAGYGQPRGPSSC